MLQQNPLAENPDLVHRKIDFRKFLQDARLPYRLFGRGAILNLKFDNKLSPGSGICNFNFHCDKIPALSDSHQLENSNGMQEYDAYRDRRNIAYNEIP
jgi:hypothetical protein